MIPARVTSVAEEGMVDSRVDKSVSSVNLKIDESVDILFSVTKDILSPLSNIDGRLPVTRRLES